MKEKKLICIADIVTEYGLSRPVAMRYAARSGAMVPGVRGRGHKILVHRAKFEKWLQSPEGKR